MSEFRRSLQSILSSKSSWTTTHRQRLLYGVNLNVFFQLALTLLFDPNEIKMITTNQAKPARNIYWDISHRGLIKSQDIVQVLISWVLQFPIVKRSNSRALSISNSVIKIILKGVIMKCSTWVLDAGVLMYYSRLDIIFQLQSAKVWFILSRSRDT